jgi:hypothetical protein
MVGMKSFDEEVRSYERDTDTKASENETASTVMATDLDEDDIPPPLESPFPESRDDTEIFDVVINKPV